MITDFNRLVKYAKKEFDVDVIFSDADSKFKPSGTYNKPSIINISSSEIEEDRIYVLLHELGHAKLCEDGDQTYWTSHCQCAGTSSDRLLEIIEESNAWYVGLQISKKLKIKIDRKKYNILKEEAIRTYFKALNKYERGLDKYDKEIIRKLKDCQRDILPYFLLTENSEGVMSRSTNYYYDCFPDESIDENIGFIREELVDIKRTKKREKQKLTKEFMKETEKEILDGLMEEVEKRRKE